MICIVPVSPSGSVTVTVDIDAVTLVSAQTRPLTDASFCTVMCEGSLIANLKLRVSMAAPFDSVVRR